MAAAAVVITVVAAAISLGNVPRVGVTGEVGEEEEEEEDAAVEGIVITLGLIWDMDSGDAPTSLVPPLLGKRTFHGVLE